MVVAATSLVVACCCLEVAAISVTEEFTTIAAFCTWLKRVLPGLPTLRYSCFIGNLQTPVQTVSRPSSAAFNL